MSLRFLAYLHVLGVGVLVGLGFGYLWWKLPEHVRRFQTWRQTRAEARPRIAAEIARIEGAFRLESFTPNSAPPPFLRERIIARWEDFWMATTPRSPELVAQRAYEKEVAGLT